MKIRTFTLMSLFAGVMLLAPGAVMATMPQALPALGGTPQANQAANPQSISAPEDLEQTIRQFLEAQGTAATAIAAGSFHTCALTDAGGVKCWGDNEFGQLGDGTKIDRTTPVEVVGLSRGVRAIATGEAHTCALTDTGGVKCWGWNWDGQLGDGTSGEGNDRSTPVEVVGFGYHRYLPLILK